MLLQESRASELRSRSIRHAASGSACTRVPRKPSMHQHPLMFTPIYGAFCCRALQIMAVLRSPTFPLFALLSTLFYFYRYMCFLLFFFLYLFIYIFFWVSLCTNIGSTITNILIMNIIIQIPEGALLTCMPHTSSTSSASSQILLSQRAQEAKSLGARPPFKFACLRGEKSRSASDPVPLPPPSLLQPPSSAPAASPPSSSPSTHARPGSAIPPLPE